VTRKKSWGNFSYNSSWVQSKGQNGEGRVSGSKGFSCLFYFASAFCSGFPDCSAEHAQEMPHELRVRQTFRISLAYRKMKSQEEVLLLISSRFH
jgi:hypothetical protein